MMPLRDTFVFRNVHPQFNQLIRRFGSTGGRKRQKLVMDAFLYSHSTWVRETVDEMLKSTKRKKGDRQ